MRSKGIILTTSHWPHHPMSMSHSSTVASTLKYHPGVTISRSCGQFCIMVELKKKIKIKKEKLNLNWVPKKILKATGVILATLLVECWLLYNNKKTVANAVCPIHKICGKGFSTDCLTIYPNTLHDTNLIHALIHNYPSYLQVVMLMKMLLVLIDNYLSSSPCFYVLKIINKTDWCCAYNGKLMTANTFIKNIIFFKYYF